MNADMVITFDRDVELNSSSASGIYLRKESNDASVSIDVEARGKQVIISPISSLSADTEYYVQISRGAVGDAINPTLYTFAGLSKNEWNFDTDTDSNDKTAPLLQSATMYNNTTIRLEYNERLESDSNLRTSYFTVTVNGETREIDDAYTSGEDVYVVLEAGVAVGQNVRISYSGSGSRSIKDRSGNGAAPFSGKEVVNGLDSVSSRPKEGNVSGDTLTLYFNSSLKSVSSNAYQQFTVTADGAVKKVSRLSHSGSKVTLYLASSVSNGEVVKVTYAPGAYPIQDIRDNEISAFSDFLVRNNKDTKAPILSGVQGSGNKVVITYNEALRTNRIPPKSYFSVLVNKSPIYVNEVKIDTDQVILTLASNFTKEQNVTLSYVSGPDGVADLNGNLAGYINLESVKYSTMPEGVRSATINGDLLEIVYNKTLRSASNLPTRQFTVLVDKASWGIESAAASGNVVALKLAVPVSSGQTVDLSYYTGTNPLYDSEGSILKSYNNMTVQNLTGGSAGDVGATPLEFLNSMSTSEFGVGGYLINSKAVTTSSSQSKRGQSIKRYVLDNTKLREALQYLDNNTVGTRNLIFEVPSSEKAAEVVFPLSALHNYSQLGKTGNIIVKHKDVMFELPIEEIHYSDISTALSTTNQISTFLKVEIETVMRSELPNKYNAGSATSVVSDPVQIHVSAYQGVTASNVVDVMHTGKVYFKVITSNSAYDTIFLVKYDLSEGTTSYVPTGRVAIGYTTVLAGKLYGNGVFGPAQGYSYFSDMRNHWAREDVNEMAGKLIVSARLSDSSQFEPDKKITRAEFAEFLVKGLGLPGDESNVRRFPDVVYGATGAYIGAAAKAGLINGYADGTFKPNNFITREQMALMMIRAMDYAGYDTSMNGANLTTLALFKDRDKIQSKMIVAKAVKEGIIQGTSMNKFLPQGQATRAEAAVMLKRVLDKLNYI